MHNIANKQLSDITAQPTSSLNQLHQAHLLEAPVAVCINGVSQAVMMISPTHLQDFALGFCLSEGLIASTQEVLDITVQTHEQGYQVDLAVLNRTNHKLKQQRRVMAGPSGCGLCGVASIKAAMQITPVNNNVPAVTNALPADNIIQQAKAALPQLVKTLGSQRGHHSAAFFDLSGQLIAIRDDVGRHSALDKLLGCLSKNKHTTTNGFALITSRCSHDLVTKAARLSLTTLVTLSQPTTLAVSSAQQAKLALFCFQHNQLKRFA